MRKALVFVISCLLILSFSFGNVSAEEKVTLTIWEWISSQGEGPVYKDVLESYDAAHPNVEINSISVPWSQAHDKVLMMSRSGNMPDIIGVNRNWLQEFVSMDLLMDLTSYVKKAGWQDRYYSAVEGSLNGKIYVLPYSGGNSALIYNKDFFEKKELQPPKTMEEFVEIGKEISNPAQNQFATQFCISEKNSTGAVVVNLAPIFYSFGAQFVKDGKAAFNSPEGVTALKWMLKLEDEKIAAPGSLTVDASSMREKFASEQIFMVFDGAWGIPFYNKIEDIDYGIARMPKGKNIGTAVNIMNWGISKSSEHKEAAWDLLKYINNDENMLRLYEEADVMPSTKEHGEMPQFQEKYKGFLETMDASENYYQTGSVPKETELYRILVRAYQKASLGQYSPQEALDQAAEEYNSRLQ